MQTISAVPHVMFTLLRRKDIRLAQRKAMVGSDPKKPLKVHGLREGIGQIRIAVPKLQELIQILKRHPTSFVACSHSSQHRHKWRDCMLLNLISCGSLALTSVLVVTPLKGLQQHNQRKHALQEQFDQLEERTPNRAHSELLRQLMGVMQDRMDAFAAMRTSAPSSLHSIPTGIWQDEALQQNEQDQNRQD